MWYPGDTVNIGIGQGYMSITPLQLAHFTATIAAHGQRFQPRLVRAVRDVQTGKVRELPPKSLGSVKMGDPAAWEAAIGGMIDVANTPYGTARAITANAQYLIAGKSGSVQVFKAAANQRVRKNSELPRHLRDHALFIAFAPADAPMPKLAVAVVVEHAPSGGSATAAPVARRILDAYLLTSDQWQAQEEKRKAAVAAAAKRALPPAPPRDHE